MTLTNDWQEVFRYYINISNNRSVPFVTYAKIKEQNNVSNTSKVNLKIESYEVNYSSNAFAAGCSSYLQGKYKDQGKYYFGTKTVQTRTVTVNHNQDGTATLKISSSFNGGAWGSASKSKTVTLPQIPRGSIINNTDASFNLGDDSITLNITKHVDTYYDVLTISVGDTILRVVDNVENGYVFTPTDAELDTIYYSTPNNKSQTITFTTTTYSSSDKTTQIGVASVFNVAGNIVNANPTLTGFDYEDTNPLTVKLSEDSTKIINGCSTLTIRNLVATANKGATLKLVQINNTQYAYDNNFSVSIPNWSGSIITMYVFDSRNNSTKLEVPLGINYVDYKEPVIMNKECVRYGSVKEESLLSFSGEWFNASFGTNDNQLSATYQYRDRNSTDWIQGSTNILLTTEGNRYSYNGYIKGDANNGFATEHSYEILITIRDSLISKSDTTILIAGEPAMDIYKSNVSFGAYYNESEPQYQSQFHKKTNFYGGVYKNGVELATLSDIPEDEGIVYSLGEHKIGTWLGKPLYRKIIDVGTITEQVYDIYHGIDNLDIAVNYWARYNRPNTAIQNTTPSTYTDWEVFLYDFKPEKIRLRLSDKQFEAGVEKLQVILEYTKTTD